MSNLKNRIIMRMRVSYLFSVFMFLLIGLYSCKDDNENPSPNPSFKITIDEGDTHPVISQQGGTINIPFTATGEWNATMINDRAESWITINPSSGKSGDIELSVTATANETYDERNATIVLQCGDDKKEIVVTQKQKDALTVTSSKYEVPSGGGNISVEVKANIEYEIEVKADWIKQVENQDTRALTSSLLNFKVDFNDTESKREGEIIIKSGNLSETVMVYQEYGDFITLTQKDFTLPEEGGTVDIEINSTVGYDVKMPSGANWITEIQSRAVSTHTRHYQVEPNESYDSREAKIIFYNTEDETIADTVSIYQMYKGAILVARNEYQFGVKGGNLNLTVKSNLEYDVTVSEEWIEKVDTRGLTEYNLTFNIKENATGKDREGMITVKDKNSDKQQTVTIKQSYKDLEREALIALYKATGGDNWINNENWCSDKPLSEWYGITLGETGHVKFISLDSNNLTGTLPEEIGNLNELEDLRISFNQLEGILPKSFWYLNKLKYFECYNNKIEGEIPEEIGDMKNLEQFRINENQFSGTLPKSIEKLQSLTYFSIGSNNINGEIPEEIGNLQNLEYLDLSYNDFSGTLPESIGNLNKLTNLFVSGNKLEGFLPEFLKNLKEIRFLELKENNFKGNIPDWLMDFSFVEKISLSGNQFTSISYDLYNFFNQKGWINFILTQQDGYKLSIEGCYESTDFSQDGEVQVLQKHSKGNGIPIVLMGDLFVDKDMNNGGLYETTMKDVMKAYFSIEPYKSLREYFDVISIKAVSKHDWTSGETALGTTMHDGWGAQENKEKCAEYARKALGISSSGSLENTQIITILKYVDAGHAGWNFNGNSVTGFSCIGYPQNDSFESFAATIHHEAGGHGFGLLDDEYIMTEGTTCPPDEIEQSKQMYEQYGYHPNVDYTSDPTQIRWTHFINDSRYKDEEIGIFEGAYYQYGVYRATEYSVMREFIGVFPEPALPKIDQFSAPSREAIYKRVMKLAYGDSWKYDYEEFVKFDAQGRADFVAAKNKAQTRGASNSKVIKHPRPTIYKRP